jgi:vitamin B12 transporter
MFFKKIFFFVLFLATQQGDLLLAQTDTSFPLPPVIIGAASLRDAMTGEKVQRFDSAQLDRYTGTDLATMLAAQGHVYIKNYGPGTLSTTAMRGGSAAQTAVTWNGIPLQSPMLGLNDLALLPVFLTDEVTVHYGSSGAQWGSGAVGGRISLQNKRPETPGWNIGLQTGLGSFGAENVQTKIQWNHRKWAAVTRLFYSDIANDFSWKINDTLPAKIQSNAAARQWAALQDVYWNISAKQQIAAHFWRQNNDRQIPPTTVQNKNAARQFDSATRATLQWKYFFKKHTFSIKTAGIWEAIDFQDTIVKTKALSDFETRFAETEDRWRINRWLSLQTGAVYTHYRATANGYKNGVTEWRTAGFATLQLRSRHWELETDLRQEWVDGRSLPPIPAAGIVWQPVVFLALKAKSARQYRLPTLNDRYWQPGGNPGLRPESGWSHEAGAILKPLKGLTLESTVYRRRIHNWILWSQLEGQSFWSSNNITEVFSRGLEQTLLYHFTWKKWGFDWSGHYTYTRSTNEKAIARPKMAPGEQLIYVPVHQANTSINLHFQAISLLYMHRYSGAVRGVNEPVAAWDTGTLRGQYNWQTGKYKGAFFIQSDNLWNRNYRVVERRPMPGRNYQTGVSIQFFQ